MTQMLFNIKIIVLSMLILALFFNLGYSAAAWTVQDLYNDAAFITGVTPSMIQTADGDFHIVFQNNTGVAANTELSHGWYDGSWHFETVYSGSGAFATGEDPVIIEDSANVLHIVFANSSNVVLNTDLGHAYGTAGAWTVEQIYDGGGAFATGVDPVIIQGTDGNLHVAFTNSSNVVANTNLGYATNATGAWVTEDVYSNAGVFATGVTPAITEDFAGDIHIVFANETNVGANVHLGHAYGTSGTWNTETIYTGSGVFATGETPAIIEDSSNVLHVAFTNDTNMPATTNLGHAYGTAGAWTVELIYDDGGAGFTTGDYPSIIEDSSNDIYIAFTNDTTMPAQADLGITTNSSGAWATTLVYNDTAGTFHTGYYPSLIEDASNQLRIAFTNDTNMPATSNLGLATYSNTPCTWNAAADGAASVAGNWINCGGVAPTAADSVIFDATSVRNCDWDLASITDINLNAGYSGTVTQSANLAVSGNVAIAQGIWAPGTKSLTITGTTTISGGTLGGNTAYTLDMNGNLLASAGTLSAPSASGSFKYSGDTWINPTTYTSNSGTITFDRAGTTTLGSAATSFYKLTVSDGTTLDTSVANNYALTASKDVTIGGGASGQITGRGSTIYFGALIINAGGTYSATTATTYITSSTSALYSIHNDGTFTHNSGTVNVYTYDSYIDMGGTGAGKDFWNFELYGGSFEYAYSNLQVLNDLNFSSGGGEFASKVNQYYTLTVAGDLEVVAGRLGSSNSLYRFGAINAGSLKIGATAKFYVGTATVTLNSETTGGYVFDNDGMLSGTATFAITTPATTLIDATGTSGNIDTLTLNNAALVLTLADTAMTLNNDLTITSGQLDTSAGNLGLTVTDDVSVSGTLTGRASTISFGTLSILAGGTYSATTGTTTITDVTAGGYSFDNDGTLTANSGTMTFIYNGAAKIDAVGAVAGNIYNMIVNHAGFSGTLDATTTINNDLTITAGTLNTDTGAAAVDFTVTGNASITGTLDAANFATSTVNFGSLTINGGGTYTATAGTTTINSETAGGYAFDNDGTLTANSGTMTFIYNGATILDAVGAVAGNIYNMIVNNAGFSGTLDATTTINNDLTITAGTLNTDTGAAAVDFTVTGNASITGTLDAANFATSTVNFGSLTINGGGTYTATAGTTTINSESAGGYSYNNDGTLTPNNGAFNFTYAGAALIDTQGTAGNIYNMNLSNAALILTQETALAVDNDLTITSGQLGANTQTITVTGDVSVTGTLTGSTAANAFGTLTVNAGGTYSATTATATVNGNWETTLGTFNDNGGTITIGGAADSSINVANAEQFTGLTINKAGGYAVVTGETFDVLANLIVNSDTNITTSNIAVTNNWNINAGAVNQTDANVTVTGATNVGVPAILRVYWYENILVQNIGLTPLAGATVTATNSTGDTIFTQITNALGRIPQQTTLEYEQTNAGVSTSDPHIITTTLAGYTTDTTTTNFDSTKLTTITLNVPSSPSTTNNGQPLQNYAPQEGLALGKTYSISPVKKGQTYEISMDDAATPIEKIQMKAGQDIEKVWFKASVIGGKDSVEGYEVYKYLSLKLMSSESILPEKNEYTVTYKVSKDWMEENNLNKKDITWLHSKQFSWSDEGAALINEDADYYYYKSTFNSFSEFAIAGKTGEKGEDVWGSVVSVIKKTFEPKEGYWWASDPLVIGGGSLLFILVLAMITLFFRNASRPYGVAEQRGGRKTPWSRENYAISSRPTMRSAPSRTEQAYSIRREGSIFTNFAALPKIKIPEISIAPSRNTCNERKFYRKNIFNTREPRFRAAISESPKYSRPKVRSERSYYNSGRPWRRNIFKL